MKLVMELVGDSVIELIGAGAFIGAFILAYSNNGIILQTIFSIITKAS